MPKILVKTKHGLYIREKSDECLENLEKVHPNKIAAWVAFSKATTESCGGTMEDVIQSVIDEMKGLTIKIQKPKVKISQEDYKTLLMQAYRKNIRNPERKLNELVETLQEPEIKTEYERLKELVKLP